MSKKRTISLIVPVALWVCIIALSLFWNINAVESNMLRTVKNVGQAFFSEIETTRLWNARHGGVYVRITKDTQPNPYLKIPDRDIESTNGIKLTKINPAFMTRQIAEIAKKENKIQYHITSLNPIRPKNAATEWEKRALESFENGVKDFLEYDAVNQNYPSRQPAVRFGRKAVIFGRNL